MTTAFDFGSFRLRSLCQAGPRLISRHCRTIYQILPATDSWRGILGDLGIGYAEGPHTLTVIGDDAERVGGLCPVPASGILPDGRLADDDPAARQMLAQLVNGLLPPAIRPGDVCCMTLPGASYLNRTSENSELNLCVHLIEMQGYDVRILSASMAVLLASSSRTGFTGIGLSFGESSCSVSLSRKGVEIAYCSIPLGGNWIDESLARSESQYIYDIDGACYLDTNSIRLWREQLQGSIAEPQSELERKLREKCDVMIERVVSECAAPLRAAAEQHCLTEPLDMYCAGGTSQAVGFNRLITRHVQTDHNFPLSVNSVRVIEDDGFTAARGCLINAEIESEILGRAA
jgi:hypothetical protein